MTPIERAAFLYSDCYPERAVRDCEREGISEADMAAGFALAVERRLDLLADARCPGSRRPLTEALTHLAAGIENRLAGSVASASVDSLEGE